MSSTYQNVVGYSGLTMQEILSLLVTIIHLYGETSNLSSKQTVMASGGFQTWCQSKGQGTQCIRDDMSIIPLA